MRTYTAKPGEVERRWYVVDADGQTLGRLATRIADTLRGKGKAQYTPHVDTGDFVVIVRPGDGATWFNGRTIEEYFPRAAHRVLALAPLKVAGAEGTYDIRVRLHGGGPSGQAGAVRHGIARALVEADPNLRVPLKRAGFLTRDARIVERKKAGLHKARRAPQFSKR